MDETEVRFVEPDLAGTFAAYSCVSVEIDSSVITTEFEPEYNYLKVKICEDKITYYFKIDLGTKKAIKW